MTTDARELQKTEGVCFNCGVEEAEHDEEACLDIAEEEYKDEYDEEEEAIEHGKRLCLRKEGEAFTRKSKMPDENSPDYYSFYHDCLSSQFWRARDALRSYLRETSDKDCQHLYSCECDTCDDCRHLYWRVQF